MRISCHLAGFFKGAEGAFVQGDNWVAEGGDAIAFYILQVAEPVQTAMAQAGQAYFDRIHF